MDSYSALFVNNSFKTAAVTFSIVSMVIVTPLLFGIILFERNKHHRTLINQLMASTVWTATLWNLTVQSMSIYRTAVGPMPYTVCRVNSVLRNSLPMYGLLLLDATMVVKFAFSFHMKNPTAVQDDFWNFFLNVSIFCFTTLSQVVHIILPGRDAQNFYICTGKLASNSVSTLSKQNYSVIFVLVVSAGIHLIFGYKYFYLKFLLKKEENQAVLTKPNRFNVSADIFISYTTNGLITLLLFSCFLVLAKVNSMDFETLKENIGWFYALHLYLPSAIEFATIVYFSKSEFLRNHLRLEFLEIYSKFCVFRRRPNQIYSIHNV
jgi:hypothetical protein